MNILVTAIGSFSADCVIKTLKRKNHNVVGCDIYPTIWHAISKECDKTYQVPYAIDKEYVNFLCSICINEKIDCIIPLTDLEIDVLNNNRKSFKDIGVNVYIQSESCLNIARDKYAMYNIFKDDIIVNVPNSISSSNLTTNFPLPAIAKPINGRSSEGLKIIENIKELEQLINIPKYIIQEKISGSVITVDYVRDKHGNDFAIPREELLRTKNGAGTTIKIINNKELNETVSYIGNKLNVVGCVNMEFIYNNDKFYLIDINPRFSAGVAFSNFIGFDMITSHINSFIGKEICNKIEIIEQIICKRYYEEKLD